MESEKKKKRKVALEVPVDILAHVDSCLQVDSNPALLKALVKRLPKEPSSILRGVFDRVLSQNKETHVSGKILGAAVSCVARTPVQKSIKNLLQVDLSSSSVPLWKECLKECSQEGLSLLLIDAARALKGPCSDHVVLVFLEALRHGARRPEDLTNSDLALLEIAGKISIEKAKSSSCVQVDDLILGLFHLYDTSEYFDQMTRIFADNFSVGLVARLADREQWQKLKDVPSFRKVITRVVEVLGHSNDKVLRSWRGDNIMLYEKFFRKRAEEARGTAGTADIDVVAMTVSDVKSMDTMGLRQTGFEKFLKEDEARAEKADDLDAEGLSTADIMAAASERDDDVMSSFAMNGRARAIMEALYGGSRFCKEQKCCCGLCDKGPQVEALADICDWSQDAGMIVLEWSNEVVGSLMVREQLLAQLGIRRVEIYPDAFGHKSRRRLIVGESDIRRAIEEFLHSGYEVPMHDLLAAILQMKGGGNHTVYDMCTTCLAHVPRLEESRRPDILCVFWVLLAAHGDRIRIDEVTDKAEVWDVKDRVLALKGLSMACKLAALPFSVDVMRVLMQVVSTPLGRSALNQWSGQDELSWLVKSLLRHGNPTQLHVDFFVAVASAHPEVSCTAAMETSMPSPPWFVWESCPLESTLKSSREAFLGVLTMGNCSSRQAVECVLRVFIEIQDSLTEADIAMVLIFMISTRVSANELRGACFTVGRSFPHLSTSNWKRLLFFYQDSLDTMWLAKAVCDLSECVETSSKVKFMSFSRAAYEIAVEEGIDTTSVGNVLKDIACDTLDEMVTESLCDLFP